MRNIVSSFVFSVFALSCLFFSTASNADQIRPFTTDGCSLFPDGTFKQAKLWLGCCTRHDYAYWQGGTYEQRVNADKQLRQCVASVGEPSIGMVMLMGVRLGGSPYLPLWFRWGYGWPYSRWYQPLSDDEIQQIKELGGDTGD